MDKYDVIALLAAVGMMLIVTSFGGYIVGYHSAAAKATPLLHKATEMIIDCRRRLGDQSD